MRHLYLILTIALFIVSIEANAQQAPDVGVIRWDAWTGDRSSTGIEVEESLGPNQWHDKLPYFATIDGPNEVTIKFEQSDMDLDIQIANEAGIDYFAFVYYTPGTPLAESVEFYKNSPNKSNIDYCFVVEGNRWNDELIDDLVTNHFTDSSYKKVLNNRPIVYLLRDGDENGISCHMNTLVAQASAAGFDPYLVGMSSASFTGVNLDARSDYFVTEKDGVPFSDLVTKAENQWDNLKASGNVVPLVTAGYDPRSRNNANNPVTWGGDIASNSYAAKGTAQEIADHLASAFTWVDQNPSHAPANTVLMYAWNEFDEGGWLCPTLGDGDTRLEAIENVINDNTTINDISDIVNYPASVAPVTLPTAGSGGILLNASFEEGNLKRGTPQWSPNWPRPWENATRLQKVYNTYTHAGAQALKVLNRRSATHSPEQDITEVLQLNGAGSYDVEVMARYYSGSDSLKIVVKTNDDNGAHTFKTFFTNVTDTYTMVSGTLNITWSGTLQNATIGIESATDYGANLYLDDFKMDVTGGGGIPPVGSGVTTLFEAEDATLSGDVVVRAVSGASAGSVANIRTKPSTIAWTIDAPTSGNYSIIFGTRSHFGNESIGARSATISSSSGSSLTYTFPASETLRQDIVTLALDAGINTITLDAINTYFEVDYMSIPQLAGGNIAPFADAGADILIEDTDNSGSENVILNGSKSLDIDGTIESYVWTIGSIEIATGVTPSIQLNTGEYWIVLTVTDDAGVSARSDLTVIVAKTGYEAEEVSLYGDIVMRAVPGASKDTVAGMRSTPSSIVWSIPDIPEAGNYHVIFGTRSHYGNVGIGNRKATISNCSGPPVTYFFPPSATVREDTIMLHLDEGTNFITFNNDWGYLEVDYLAIPGAGGSNEAPVANSGADQTIADAGYNGSETVSLNGTASSDDGFIEEYVWTENGIQIANEVTASINLTLGTHEIVLTVTDNDGVSSNDTVTVTVSPVTFEAEHATLNGDINIRTLLGASNDEVAGVETTPSSVVWTITDVADSGNYEVTIATRSHYGTITNGSRRATISSSVGSSVTYDFPASATIREDIINLALDQGTNTITLNNDWGYLEVDYLSIQPASSSSSRLVSSTSENTDEIENDLQDNDVEIAIYPNPSSGSIKVTGVKDLIEIYNMLGAKVLEKVAEEGQVTNIDLSGRPGVYILKTSITTRKVIIQN